MDFLSRVLSVNGRTKEKEKVAEQAEKAFHANLDDIARMIGQEQNQSIYDLVEMIYDSSFPEEQMFIKHPSVERLKNNQQLVARLLSGLIVQGVPGIELLCGVVEKNGVEPVALSIITLLNLLSPLLTSKESPTFTTDDLLNAIDFGWHSSSKAASPLLHVLSSKANSPARVGICANLESPSRFKSLDAARNSFLERLVPKLSAIVSSKNLSASQAGDQYTHVLRDEDTSPCDDHKSPPQPDSSQSKSSSPTGPDEALTNAHNMHETESLCELPYSEDYHGTEITINVPHGGTQGAKELANETIQGNDYSDSEDSMNSCSSLDYSVQFSPSSACSSVSIHPAIEEDLHPELSHVKSGNFFSTIGNETFGRVKDRSEIGSNETSSLSASLQTRETHGSDSETCHADGNLSPRVSENVAEISVTEISSASLDKYHNLLEATSVTAEKVNQYVIMGSDSSEMPEQFSSLVEVSQTNTCSNLSEEAKASSNYEVHASVQSCNANGLTSEDTRYNMNDYKLEIPMPGRFQSSIQVETSKVLSISPCPEEDEWQDKEGKESQALEQLSTCMINPKEQSGWKGRTCAECDKGNTSIIGGKDDQLEKVMKIENEKILVTNLHSSVTRLSSLFPMTLEDGGANLEYCKALHCQLECEGHENAHDDVISKVEKNHESKETVRLQTEDLDSAEDLRTNKANLSLAAGTHEVGDGLQYRPHPYQHACGHGITDPKTEADAELQKRVRVDKEDTSSKETSIHGNAGDIECKLYTYQQNCADSKTGKRSDEHDETEEHSSTEEAYIICNAETSLFLPKDIENADRIECGVYDYQQACTSPKAVVTDEEAEETVRPQIQWISCGEENGGAHEVHRGTMECKVRDDGAMKQPAMRGFETQLEASGMPMKILSIPAHPLYENAGAKASQVEAQVIPQNKVLARVHDMGDNARQDLLLPDLKIGVEDNCMLKQNHCTPQLFKSDSVKSMKDDELEAPVKIQPQELLAACVKANSSMLVRLCEVKNDGRQESEVSVPEMKVGNNWFPTKQALYLLQIWDTSGGTEKIMKDDELEEQVRTQPQPVAVCKKADSSFLARIYEIGDDGKPELAVSGSEMKDEDDLFRPKKTLYVLQNCENVDGTVKGINDGQLEKHVGRKDMFPASMKAASPALSRSPEVNDDGRQDLAIFGPEMMDTDNWFRPKQILSVRQSCENGAGTVKCIKDGKLEEQVRVNPQKRFVLGMKVDSSVLARPHNIKENGIQESAVSSPEMKVENSCLLPQQTLSVLQICENVNGTVKGMKDGELKEQLRVNPGEIFAACMKADSPVLARTHEIKDDESQKSAVSGPDMIDDDICFQPEVSLYVLPSCEIVDEALKIVKNGEVEGQVRANPQELMPACIKAVSPVLARTDEIKDPAVSGPEMIDAGNPFQSEQTLSVLQICESRDGTLKGLKDGELKEQIRANPQPLFAACMKADSSVLERIHEINDSGRQESAVSGPHMKDEDNCFQPKQTRCVLQLCENVDGRVKGLEDGKLAQQVRVHPHAEDFSRGLLGGTHGRETDDGTLTSTKDKELTEHVRGSQVQSGSSRLSRTECDPRVDASTQDLLTFVVETSYDRENENQEGAPSIPQLSAECNACCPGNQVFSRGIISFAEGKTHESYPDLKDDGLVSSPQEILRKCKGRNKMKSSFRSISLPFLRWEASKGNSPWPKRRSMLRQLRGLAASFPCLKPPCAIDS